MLRYVQLVPYRDDVIIAFGLVSMIVLALLSAWAYARLFGQSGSWRRGALRFGLFFGVLARSLAVLPVAADAVATEQAPGSWVKEGHRVRRNLADEVNSLSVRRVARDANWSSR